MLLNRKNLENTVKWIYVHDSSTCTRTLYKEPGYCLHKYSIHIFLKSVYKQTNKLTV